MRVSIAMATYNGSAYVAEQLDSFARQTRLPDELVICDDCSTDDTVAKVEGFAAYAPFTVRIERNPQNLATTANFGRAVDLCQGDVILLADQDDVWRPEKIETLARVFEDDASVGVAFSNARVVDAALEPMGHDLWTGLMFERAEQARVRSGHALDVFVRHVVAAGTTLGFRSVYRDLYLPFPELQDCHDAWISFLIACVSSVRLIPQELIDYRVHGENQFGLRRLSLSEQLKKARWQIESGIFGHGERFFSSVRERLAHSSRPVADATLALIDAKIEHCRSRDAMNASLRARLPVILRELGSLRYWRFSYGIKSLAQDLWLR